jgi:glycosyltransferase involved in cell wall biosynthesis
MHITHIITGLNDGGAEAVLYRLCTHDTAFRHTVISLMHEGKYGTLLVQAGVTVHCLNLPRGQVRLAALWRLWRLLRQLRPDVVQTWMYHADLIGGVIARLAGVRNVVWGIRHTTLEPGKSSRGTIWVARLLARLSRLVPRRIAVCAHKAVAVHGALGYDTTRMVVIPNGYNLAQFAPDATARARLRAEWAVSDALPLLGMVGRFDPQKDHANLLLALDTLRQQGLSFRCVLVGAGLTESNSELARHIQHTGLKEQMLLLGQRDDIPAIMNALDVHVLSSAYGEAFPNVLAEAMACGMPCVTTDVGDAALIVCDTGWVLPPRDSEALANGIDQALKCWQHRNSWQERQRVCRQRIEAHYSLEAMVTSYSRVWREKK